MKRRSIVGLAVVVAVGLTGCASSDGSSAKGSGASGNGGSTDVGVTGSEILVGATAPLTGPGASYGDIPKAVQAYFDHVNEQGGVNGRKFKYIVYDDALDPSKTVPLTDKLVNQDKVFALVGGVGTPAQSAVYKKLNAQKVPDALIISGSSAFVDPPLPYVTSVFPRYSKEDELLAKHLKDTYPGQKVGVLTNTDDQGVDFVKAFGDVLGADLVAKSTYELTDASLAAQISSLKSAGAQAVGFSGTAKSLALALKAARDQGWNAPFVSSGPSVNASLLELAGPAAEGLVTATGFKDATDTADPGVKEAIDILTKNAPTIKPSVTSMWGIAIGKIFVEGVKKAGNQLTRDSLVAAFNDLQVEQGTWYGSVKMSGTQRNAVSCEQLLQVKSGALTKMGDLQCAS